MFEISVDPPSLRLRLACRCAASACDGPPHRGRIDGSEMFGHLAPWDNQCTPAIMTMSAALVEKWARPMGRFTRALTASHANGGKKAKPSQRARAKSVGHSRAPFRAPPIVAEKTRPQGCKLQDISERTTRKAINQGGPSLITKVLATHRI